MVTMCLIVFTGICKNKKKLWKQIGLFKKKKLMVKYGLAEPRCVIYLKEDFQTFEGLI